ncbi:DUF3626 domain-containing protein [Flammeovirga agarivorans]|uniref:DUF3626 domain-containing protein n=1 Tax=Flammeovirga agarivorans TaxID=2726742 RepID=A0A7X8SJV4_9BACT|nr:DUF3626 domain-containing protein [Flammeovirga agarivorans]NLR91463.1 DUF3626 domain-containing protein [Flammeovirga agarivorans]
MLTSSQLQAIENVSKTALMMKEKSQELIDMILYQSNIDMDLYVQFYANLIKNAPVALHFHPDRISNQGNTITEGLLSSGVYKNQFETNISSGSVSAHLGGLRNEWEDDIFKGAYTHSEPKERAKYGALHLTHSESGPAPRFGSCYFVLHPEVNQRTTFTYGDTYASPKEVGTIQHIEPIISALFNDLSTRESALGENNITTLEFITLINQIYLNTINQKSLRPFSQNLDFYIEAQIHGEISLEKDVSELIVDYSFFNTKVGNTLMALSQKYKIQLHWNSGLELGVDEFPNNFRGPEVPKFAKQFGHNGKLNPFLLGKAALEIGNEYEELQMLKYLWHCLVKFGRPIQK